ncbi:MAG: GAF domain-containing sensor histidine kinase [Chitinophagales bacterium]|nr:GAF domain-containing sensor histidine kinase [Chitinophagales bacterium]
MVRPAIPINEEERLNSLGNYNLINTLPEKDFDDITRIASKICNTPISLVSLITADKQWFKSHHGIDVLETDRELSFCAHAILTPKNILEVSDARKDARFADNPLVVGEPHVIFYAGVPLVNQEGMALGTLCIIDHYPKSLSDDEKETLVALANQVVKLFELRRTNKELRESRWEVRKRNKNLERFAYSVSHDIKSPLNNIIGFSEILRLNNLEQLDEDGKSSLRRIENSSRRLKKLIDGIIDYYRQTNTKIVKLEDVDLVPFMKEIVSGICNSDKCSVYYPKDNHTIQVNKTILEQILVNLISNSIKYNREDVVVIEIGFSESDSEYQFYVRDNGIGIEDKDQKRVFELFNTLYIEDRYGNIGSGIGLSTVKNLVESNGGEIELESAPDAGTLVRFSLARPIS